VAEEGRGCLRRPGWCRRFLSRATARVLTAPPSRLPVMIPSGCCPTGGEVKPGSRFPADAQEAALDVSPSPTASPYLGADRERAARPER